MFKWWLKNGWLGGFVMVKLHLLFGMSMNTIIQKGIYIDNENEQKVTYKKDTSYIIAHIYTLYIYYTVYTNERMDL